MAEAVSNSLSEFRQRRAEIAGNPRMVRETLSEGAEKARLIASETLKEVKRKMGLI
jgi:tryptophanyl-tRNA synthetase